MSVVWMTKFGARRVRDEAPTIAEAIAAAETLSDDKEQQAEIAASLLDIDPAEVRAVMARTIKRVESQSARTLTLSSSRSAAPARTVVVEYKTSRRAR